MEMLDKTPSPWHQIEPPSLQELFEQFVSVVKRRLANGEEVPAGVTVIQYVDKNGLSKLTNINIKTD